MDDTQTASEAMKPLVVVCVVYIILDVFFVTLRFISRFIIRRSEVGWDDWLIIPAFICNVAACACGLLVAHYGSIGDRPANKAIIAPDQIYTQLIPTLKVTFASIILLILGFTLPKLSILILYLRIFTGRKTRLVSWITIALVAAQGVAFCVASIFACAPVEYFWNKLILDGECINLNFFYQSFGLPNIVIDAMILITPLPAIWGLQASVARRTGITFIFLTGVVAMIVSCIRWNLYSKSDVYIIQPKHYASLTYINIVECSTYLIAACLPASYPAFNALLPRMFQPRAQAIPSQLPIYNRVRPTPSPAMGRLTTTAVEEKGDARISLTKLVESPIRACHSPGRLSPINLPESPRTKGIRPSREQHRAHQGSPRITQVEREEDALSMTTHGRSQSRAETVHREEDEDLAMAELRRLASEHRLPMMPDGEDGGLIAVHTEIEVTHEDKNDKGVGSPRC